MSKLKEAASASAPLVSVAGKKDKKSAQVEDQNKATQARLSQLQFRTTFAVMFLMVGMFSLVSSLYDGRAIARLPFVPVSLVSSLSHRNLPGSDFADCSVYLIYAICSLTFRTTLQRALGIKQPKGSDPFSALLPQPPKM